jgi:hypothetical protein
VWHMRSFLKKLQSKCSWQQTCQGSTREGFACKLIFWLIGFSSLQAIGLGASVPFQLFNKGHLQFLDILVYEIIFHIAAGFFKASKMKVTVIWILISEIMYYYCLPLLSRRVIRSSPHSKKEDYTRM